MAVIAYRLIGLAVALLALTADTAAAEGKPDFSRLKAGPIAVTSKRITTFKRFAAEQPLPKVIFRGGIELTSPSPYFGGWSALLLDDDAKSFVSISDVGEWMTGTLAYDGVHLAGIANARLGSLLDACVHKLKRGR
ncbi:MAG: hypothetical protein JSS54_14625, partial [Proteobacteria bacterium]|nr:hypothetical protein [Pseudomonadota bacterium]